MGLSSCPGSTDPRSRLALLILHLGSQGCKIPNLSFSSQERPTYPSTDAGNNRHFRCQFLRRSALLANTVIQYVRSQSRGCRIACTSTRPGHTGRSLYCVDTVVSTQRQESRAHDCFEHHVRQIIPYAVRLMLTLLSRMTAGKLRLPSALLERSRANNS